MDNGFHFNPSNSGTHIKATSRPLFSIIGDETTQSELFYQQGDTNSAENVTSDVESGLFSGPRSKETKLCCQNGSCCCRFLTSGKLFRLITKTTGLWNPRKKHHALLCIIFVTLNIVSLLAEILIPRIYGPFVDRFWTAKFVTNATNGTGSGTQSQAIFAKIYEATLSFDAWNAFSDIMTYILLIYTLFRAEKQLPSLSLASAQAKVTSCEWLLMNVMFIIFSLAITFASAFPLTVVTHNKVKFYVTFALGVLIVYLTAFACCCVFVVLTCALGRLPDMCFQDICSMGEGNVNDVTAMHQRLCKQLSSACQILKPWFLVHWFMFGMYCLAVFAFDSMHFGLLTRQFSGSPTVFLAIVFTSNFAIFLVPCVYASRVTWKCEDLLYKINNMSSGDWNEGHPFRERAEVNAFIFYAERSKCGFRIGKMTFGSSGTWISVFLGLFGFGIRVFDYIK